MNEHSRQSEVEITVPFYDIDSMNVAWHGNYAKYFEIARCALLDSFNYGYKEMRASGYAWPVTELFIRYPRSLFFNQKVKVIATLVEYESRLKIKYLILDAATKKILTKGHTVQVAVDLSNNEMSFVLPEIFYERLGIESP